MKEIAFLMLALISLIFMSWAYQLGSKSILDEFKEYRLKRREREQRWREFEDE